MRARRDAAELPLLIKLLQHCEFQKKLGFCEFLFARALAERGISWVRTAAGIRWKLDLRNATHRWIVYGKYEGAPFLDWAKTYLRHDAVILDSGANIGQMLLYLAQWVPEGRVLAIEPGAHQADWLRECLNENARLPVELIRVGLGADSADAFLQESGEADRHGSWNKVSTSEGEPIRIVRLDDLLRQHGIKTVDLWKLDVEGFEIPALQGAEEYLLTKQIRALYVELRGENGRNIREHLEQRGYDCFLFRSNGQIFKSGKLPEDTNGLFLPRAAF